MLQHAGAELPHCDVVQERDEARALVHDIATSIIHHQAAVTRSYYTTRRQLTTRDRGVDNNL